MFVWTSLNGYEPHTYLGHSGPETSVNVYSSVIFCNPCLDPVPQRVSVVQICTYERKLQEIGKIPESISPSASNEKRPLLRSSEFGSHEGHESATTAWMTFLFFSFTIRIRRPQCLLRVSVLPYWWVFKATMWSASVLHQPQFPSLIFAEYHVAFPPKMLRLSSCVAGAAITNVTSVATKARNENCIAKKERLKLSSAWVIQAYLL